MVKVYKDFEGLLSLIAFACGIALLAAVEQVWSAHSFDAPVAGRGVWPACVGAFLGVLVGALQTHPRRRLGIIPIAMTALTITLIVCATLDQPGNSPSFLLGLFGGLLFISLSANFLIAAVSSPRTEIWLAIGLAVALIASLGSVVVPWSITYNLGWNYSGPTAWWMLAAFSAVGAVVAWRFLLQPALEQMLEIVIWPLYRIRAYGPGFKVFPRRGPVVVVANHCAWLDPLWLAKVIPRRVVPMMTSSFYDLPVMHFLMKHVAHAVRVQDSTFRREAPEIDEAIKVLDRNLCLLVFPEGRLRRTEEKLLHPFGQGVGRILQARPRTPVVVCWIEGNWGSFFSYYKGRPTKNKRMDFWRRIRIAANTPVILDENLLADRKAIRVHLMEKCLAAREHLGFEPVSLQSIPSEQTPAIKSKEAG